MQIAQSRECARRELPSCCVERFAEVGPPPELDLVDELRERLDADPALKAAFESLTPGRQRAYNLHVAGAKRSETRVARVDEHVPRILEGKGPNDR